MSNSISLASFLKKINKNQAVCFDETMSVIAENYKYTPVEFSNGLNKNKLINAAGMNEGSCKIFAFAQIHHLNKAQTLMLFGDFYSKDVIQNPTGTGHQNIRNFIQYGWKGISFSTPALTAK